MSTDNKLADAPMFGNIIAADFDNDTLTLKMEPGYYAAAGRFQLQRVALAEHDAKCDYDYARNSYEPVQPPANGEAELPPLPDRFDSVSVDDFTGHRLSVYTASQMESYARAAIAARTCPLPAHWRRAIEERGIENPKALDWIEQRARQMAKAGGERG